MKFQAHHSNTRPSADSYRWVSRPRLFPGQHLDRANNAEDRCFICQVEATETIPKQRLLRLFKNAIRLHFKSPRHLIG